MLDRALGQNVLMIAPLLIGFCALALWRWQARRQQRRSPFTKSFLRAPGSYVRKQVSDLQDDMLASFVGLAALGAYMAGLLAGHQSRGHAGAFYWGAITLVCLMGTAYLVYRIITRFKAFQTWRLGLDGEIAVGEELNRLMLAGYRVYHDVPGQNFNIDHVVFGATGIFAIETKAHAKQGNGYEAEFDGRVIRYPDCADSDAVRQADRNADLLSTRLRNLLGRKVRVTPIVVLPGWSVKRTQASQGVRVYALGEIVKWLPRTNNGEWLDAIEIEKIVDHMERVCRSESPYTISASDQEKFAQKVTV